MNEESPAIPRRTKSENRQLTSGTNDKARSWINLERWIPPRTVNENFLPPTDLRYPYMEKE